MLVDYWFPETIISKRATNRNTKVIEGEVPILHFRILEVVDQQLSSTRKVTKLLLLKLTLSPESSSNQQRMLLTAKTLLCEVEAIKIV